MMEAKPAPREVPVEKARTKRPSLRLVKPMAEVEEAKHVKSIRKSVAEAKRPVNEVDQLRAAIKSLRGRIKVKLGHEIQGNTAEEIKANISFGDRAKSWLDGIMGRRKENTGFNDLINELQIKEKALEIKLGSEISVVEPAPLLKKPKTLRDIKTRIAELEAKQAAEADKALESVHVEVVEEKPVVKKQNIGDRIEKAKAKSKTLGTEDIIPEIKTSSLAESVRMPEAEVEIPVTFEEEEEDEPKVDRMEAKPDFDNDLQSILHLSPESALYKNRKTPEFKSRLSNLIRRKLDNDSEVNALEKSIKALRDKGQEEKAITTEKGLEKIGDEWVQAFNKEMDDLESLAKIEALEGVVEIATEPKEKPEPKPSLRTIEKKAKREKFRKDLAEEVTHEKVKSSEDLEKKFWEQATQRLNDRAEAVAKVNFDYEYLVRQKKNPVISKLILDLVRQDVNKKISEDARLEEESILKDEFQERLSKARKAGDKDAESSIQKEFDQAMEAFRKQTIDLSYQWAIEYEEKLDKIAARAKEIEEEAALPQAEIIEEKRPSEVAPPPPTARERKRRIEFQKALSGRADIEQLEELEPIEESISKKAPPLPSAEERKRRSDQQKEDLKFEDKLTEEDKKAFVEAAAKFAEEDETKLKAGFFGQILRDHPSFEKHRNDPGFNDLLTKFESDILAFEARQADLVQKARGKRTPKVIKDLRELAFERSEFINKGIGELEKAVKAIENPQEKVPTIRTKEKADAYQGLRQDLRDRIKDEKQIEEYIELAGYRDRYLRQNDEIEAAVYQARIDKMNKEWNKQGLIGDNEDPSVALTGKSGIGRMGAIGSDMATKRVQRGKYEGDRPSWEKTRSKLERTRRIETKELQPFNTAWAIEKLGVGAAKRWDLVAPVIIEGKLGPAIAEEINKIVSQVESLDETEKENLSDEYKTLANMMETVRQTERFNQSPESAAYIFLRAMSPKDFSDFLAQDIVEAGLAKLDQLIAKTEQEIVSKKEVKNKEEKKGFSMARAKPAPRGTSKPETLKATEPVPKTKKAR
ncbi:MAG: hypothetical protein PHW33_04610, partial [Candidatus Portnoybacteria bacterium]|nr:hypothetical protein [Candidatus Portnoybacteria bacterium]